MSQFGNRLNVADVARRVADRLAEDRAGRLVINGAISPARSLLAKRASIPFRLRV